MFDPITDAITFGSFGRSFVETFIKKLYLKDKYMRYKVDLCFQSANRNKVGLSISVFRDIFHLAQFV